MYSLIEDTERLLGRLSRVQNECNLRKWEEETVMSRSDHFLSNILIHPMVHAQMGGGVGRVFKVEWGESSGEGLKRIGSWIWVWKEKRRIQKKWKRGKSLNEKSASFHTLTALVSLSSNYFNIIRSSSWRTVRRFLLCYLMMSFISLQSTKSCKPPTRPTTQNPSSNIPELRHIFRFINLCEAARDIKANL